ncbi:MAG: hypothetical protein PHS14_17095 [Elusimicrobia bacterium]|nr:hypothetical protein [Elusimicrobiota bacterium]
MRIARNAVRSAVLTALLASPALAADAPAPAAPVNSALAILSDSFGEPGVETLAARGVIVLQGKPGARRLAAVHWKAFGALAQAASSCLALTSAADALGREPEPSAPALDLAACRALPADGLMTPSLQALAAALQAGHEERWALHLASAPPSGVPGKPNLFDTAWGKDLILRRHADALENPASLAKPVFDELLAGPRPDKEAAALFAAEASARGAASVETLLAYDAAHGALSEELRAQLRRTLSNERRRWAAEKARAAAADLLGKAPVKRELEDLRNAAKALSSRPNLPAALEAAASRAASASGGVRLKSAGLHLQEPTRLGQHELGDEATVSGAYWVDGLKENDSIEVAESLAVETERGFSSVETRAYKRRNGGPYPFTRTVKITETRPFAVRSLVSAAGSELDAERVEVPLAQDFELALLKESEAAGLRAACRLKDAEAAYQALETLVAEPAKVKPQYKGLSERARRAREESKLDGETLLKLEEALGAARADSAPQLCRYETGRVDEALKLAKRLPPGCDRDLPELHALRATITRRAADQNWFLKASSEARSKRKSCDLDAARARWSEALASLDADPGARCGRVAEEEGRAKTDFAELTRKIAWREALGKSLAKAEAETAPSRRLEILRPVTSRLGALNADCFSAESRRAASLSAAASKALTAPADNEMARRLPPELALAASVSEVRAERARRLEAAGAAEKAAMETAASPSAAAPKAAAAAPAPKSAAKKQPARRAKRKTKEAAAQ